MVSICLHGVISWSQASGRGRFGPTKTVIAEKYHPSVLKFCLTWTVYNISNKMTKFYDDVYSFEPVRGCQFLKLYISMFEKWLESPQWLLAVSKPKVRMRVTSAWGQECHWKGSEGPGRGDGGGGSRGHRVVGGGGGGGGGGDGLEPKGRVGPGGGGEEYSDWLRKEASGRLL